MRAAILERRRASMWNGCCQRIDPLEGTARIPKQPTIGRAGVVVSVAAMNSSMLR